MIKKLTSLQIKCPFTSADLKKIFSLENIISVAKRALKLLQGFFSLTKIILQVIYKKFLRKRKIISINKRKKAPPINRLNKPKKVDKEEENVDNYPKIKTPTLPPPVNRLNKPKKVDKEEENVNNHPKIKTLPLPNSVNHLNKPKKVNKKEAIPKKKELKNIPKSVDYSKKYMSFLKKPESIKFYQKLIHTEIQEKAIKKIVKKLMSIQPQKKIKIQNIKKKKTTKNSKKKNKKEEYLYKVTLNLIEIAKFIPLIPFTINKIIKKGNRDACAIDFLRLLYEDLDSRKKTAYLLNNHKKHAGIKIFMKNTFSGIIYNIKQSKFQFGKKSLKGFVSSLTKTQKDSENLIKKLAPHFKKMDKFEKKTVKYIKFFKRKTKIIKKPLFTEEDYKKLLAILFPKSLYLKTPTPPSSS